MCSTDKSSLSACKDTDSAAKGSKTPAGLKRNGNRETIFTGAANKESIQNAARNTLSSTSLTQSRRPALLWAVSAAENQSTVATTAQVSVTNENMVRDISLAADSDKSLLDSTAVSTRDYCLQDHRIITQLKSGFNRTNLKSK